MAFPLQEEHRFPQRAMLRIKEPHLYLCFRDKGTFPNEDEVMQRAFDKIVFLHGQQVPSREELETILRTTWRNYKKIIGEPRDKKFYNFYIEYEETPYNSQEGTTPLRTVKPVGRKRDFSQAFVIGAGVTIGYLLWNS